VSGTAYQPPLTFENAARQRNAQWLIDYLLFHNRKVYLTPETRANIERRSCLDRIALDQAIADLLELGHIELHMAGELEVVALPNRGPVVSRQDVLEERLVAGIPDPRTVREAVGQSLRRTKLLRGLVRVAEKAAQERAGGKGARDVR
jgi:hypothetical protein